MTITAPGNPWTAGATDTQPKPVTKSGMATGTTSRTAQKPATGQVGLLHQPGRGRADDGADRGDHDRQPHRVPHQAEGAPSKDEVDHLRPPDLGCLDHHVDQREGEQEGDGQGGEPEEDRSTGPGRYPRRQGLGTGRARPGPKR